MRTPITEQSLAGFAKYLRPVNVGDAYSLGRTGAIHPSLTTMPRTTKYRLQNQTSSRLSGRRRKQISHGVIQLLNKKSGGRFTRKDEECVAEIAKSLGTAFYTLRKTSKKPPSKYDYLLTNGKISQHDLDGHSPRQKGTTDIEVAVHEKYKSQSRDRQITRQFPQVPYIEYNERTIVDIELLKNLNVDYLKNHWMPLKAGSRRH